MTERRRLAGILLAVVAMVAAVFGVGELIRHRAAPEARQVAWPKDDVVDRTPVTEPPARHRERALPLDLQADPAAKQRTLAVYYDRRAYAGAPPVIPHPVEPAIAQAMACNVCHEKGGFVPKWNAYTPVTPHPQFSNCTQCHVSPRTDELFRDTAWKSVEPPDIHRPALPGSPPPIPHELHLREDCLSCHGGAAAVPAIRTTHPQRESCTQCHVPRSALGLFERPARGEP